MSKANHRIWPATNLASAAFFSLLVLTSSSLSLCAHFNLASPHAMDEDFKDSVIIVMSIASIISTALATIFFQLWMAYRLEFRRWSV